MNRFQAAEWIRNSMPSVTVECETDQQVTLLGLDPTALFIRPGTSGLTLDEIETRLRRVEGWEVSRPFKACVGTKVFVAANPQRGAFV